MARALVVSNKAFYPLHVKGLEFVRKLSKVMDIDVFGKGANTIEDKWYVSYRRKYHVSLENFVSPDYFTCKLTDAFLAGAYPFCFSDPNIFDYFLHQSLTAIDINDFQNAYNRMSYAFTHNFYEDAIQGIVVARNKILDELSIFPSMVRLMNIMNPDATKDEVTLIPARKLQSLSVRIRCRLWKEFCLLRTKRKAEKAIYELSKGKMRDRRVR